MQENNKPWSVPAAILGAGAMIAVAVLLSGFTKTPAREDNGTTEIEVAKVSNSDHILGSKDAEVVVIEYSDFECPFCKNFHKTMHQIVSDYGDKVAWVYRQYPLESLHSRAPKEAEASECATEQGGNDMFWKFADRIFETTSSNDTLDPAELPTIARALGLDVSKFNTCLSSGKYTAKIVNDVNAALKAGARGTPYSVIIKGKNQIPIDGAAPYENMKAKIDSLLN